MLRTIPELGVTARPASPPGAAGPTSYPPEAEGVNGKLRRASRRAQLLAQPPGEHIGALVVEVEGVDDQLALVQPPVADLHGRPGPAQSAADFQRRPAERRLVHGDLQQRQTLPVRRRQD